MLNLKSCNPTLIVVNALCYLYINFSEHTILSITMKAEASCICIGKYYNNDKYVFRTILLDSLLLSYQIENYFTIYFFNVNPHSHFVFIDLSANYLINQLFSVCI